MLDKAARLYASNFTADGLRQLARFYATPPGMKLLAVGPRIAVESLQSSLERIALAWNRAAIQERVNPLGQTRESVFS